MKGGMGKRGRWVRRGKAGEPCFAGGGRVRNGYFARGHGTARRGAAPLRPTAWQPRLR